MKQGLCEDFLALQSTPSSHFCIMGDFNVVRSESEKKGSLFYKAKAEDFNNFINHANLLDLSLGCKKFTWIGQGGAKLSKLDRFLV